MGFPMRYPRSLNVLFVALALVGWPVAAAHSHNADAGADALIGNPIANTRPAASDPDAVRRVVIVEAFAAGTDLDRERAGDVLDAMADTVLAIAETGARVGVLAATGAEPLMDAALEIAAAADPASAQAAAKAAYLSERPDEAIDLGQEPDPVRADPSVETDAIKRWQKLIERYFPPERVDEALAIVECESGGDPDATNPRSSAAGLFQFIDGTWAHASEQAGFAGASPHDPEANVAAAAWLVGYSLDVGDAPWAHWTCRP